MSDSAHSSDDQKESKKNLKRKKNFRNDLSQHLKGHSSKEAKSQISLKKFHPISDSEDEDGDKDLFPNDEPKAEVERPKCQYWEKCYRKNPEHLKEFSHPATASSQVEKKKDTSDSKLRKIETPTSSSMKSAKENSFDNPYGFFLTKVQEIPAIFNQEIAYDIKDLLSLVHGTLKASAQFNYMFDIPWLMEQYPQVSRKCPLLVVHGEQRESKKSLEQYTAIYSNIQFCQAKLEIPFGTHHTKMMFLLYEKGFRVIIHTSNLVSYDWHQRTQGMWVSPIFPPLQAASESQGESRTNFKADLLEYIRSYRAKELFEWCEVIKNHDMSSANVFIIGSSPGRHVGSQKTLFGHLKLRKVLRAQGPSSDHVRKDWYVVGQFSSIGSLGSDPKNWLCSEFLTSLATTKNIAPLSPPPLKLVFPSVENVRCCLEGYPAGTSLPYSIKVASKQPYLKTFLHHWKSDRVGRSEASPHIKTYLRVSPDHKNIAWFLVTSANLSKAAWGSLEKKETQLMIRSYELGVLLLPEFFGNKQAFAVPQSRADSLIVPFDIPLSEYKTKDEPWIYDIPHVYGPDRFGNKWCPP